MAALVLGGVALALGLALLRLFASARVAVVRQALAWAAATLAVVVGGLLLFSGRGIQALWALGLFAPMLWRWWQARRFSQAPSGFGSGAAAGDSGAAATAVETAWLAMRLDHASGEMSGRVRRGGFAGRELAELDLTELLSLLAECRSQDADAVPLLEAWLDRARPDWRAAASGAPRQPEGGAMDRAEALAVLGLAEGASREAIRAAHRRLMQAAHPDHGGSDWLAARVNQARDLLFRE